MNTKKEKFVRRNSRILLEQDKWLKKEAKKRGIGDAELDRQIYGAFVNGTFSLPVKK